MNCLPRPLRNWISSRHGATSAHTTNGHRPLDEPVVLVEVDVPSPPCVVMVCHWHEERGVLVCRWTRLDEVEPDLSVRDLAVSAETAMPFLPRFDTTRHGSGDPMHSPG